MQMKTVDWVALISTIVGIVPLVGLPGALAMISTMPVMEVIYWGKFTNAFTRMNDSLWGVALLLTLIWTPALSPVWRLVERWKPGLGFWKHLGWTCLGMWIWAMIGTFILAECFIKPRQL